MTHPGGRWDREAMPVEQVRAQAFVLSAPHVVRSGADEEVEAKAWEWLNRFPCLGCGLESTCLLAYHSANEGRSTEVCERDVRS